MSDLEQIAIERLRAASEMSLQNYGLPLVITDSGGKDSSVVKELARRSGIPFEIQHNHTTADAPETVRFVRQEAKRFEDMGIKYTINMPMYKGKRTSMWNLIPQKLMPPTRLVRYCCSELKETGGAGRFIATGVRWDESASRKNNRGIFEKNGDKEHRIILNNDNDDRRMLFENCRLKSKRTVNPIIDWTDDDVWDFLQSDDAPLAIHYTARDGSESAASVVPWREQKDANWSSLDSQSTKICICWHLIDCWQREVRGRKN